MALEEVAVVSIKTCLGATGNSIAVTVIQALPITTTHSSERLLMELSHAFMDVVIG